MISRALVAFLFAVVTLAGCSSSEPDAKSKKPSSSSTSVAAPAEGDTVTTDDYTYSLPKGWEEPRGETPGFDFHSVATDVGDKDGFADNINVIRVGEAPSDDLGQFEDESVKELTRLGAKEIEVLPPESIDDAKSIHITARTSFNDVEYRTNQYGVVHDDIVFIVTFSFSVDVTPEEQSDTIESVLATWKWAA
ncbi:hypothetical protein J2X11_000033 [Aeromicrobium panaciterrae]|uniref:PsbP C-terminal domain-containing protein n=1 Tax=Aeromicrobium panaciterrae TaxID=363861 RepID=A0ABU1UJ36_9ACTN|nr:hypothetical protein [Aeromicrobium panaciterrae]MDR7085194.1 hypothetical protein [Aeromicrobium panaciterrae]